MDITGFKRKSAKAFAGQKDAFGGLLALTACAGALLVLSTGTAYATTLSAASTAVTIGYTLPSTPGTPVTDVLTATTASTFFNVVTSTVPGWLTVTQTGTTSTGTTSTATVSFAANATAGAMLPGTYTASVQFNSAMGTNPTIVVTLAIKAAPAKFTAISSNATQTWNPGSSTGVTVTIACSSNGEPISFAVALGGQMGPNMTSTPSSGIAYSWGTTVSVTIPISYLLPIAVGTPLTGTVTLTPNNGANPTVINVNVNINPPASNITSYSISEVPVDLTNDHTVVVTGTGFATGVTSVQAKVHTGGSYATLDAGHIAITGPTSMVVTLDHSTYLKATGQIDIQVENSASSWLPSSPLTLAVVTTPIIYSITNAASFTEPVSGASPTVAPYEIISIFGANFDTANGLVNNTSYTAAPGIFGSTVTNSKGQAVIVDFCIGNVITSCAGSSPTNLLAAAGIIFVSNNQINAIVPVEVEGSSLADLGANSATTGANVLVSVGGTTNDANNTFLLNTAVSAPGVFTPDGTGRGAAAVLNHDWTLNTASNPNPKGQVFHIYLTGLGDPPSTGADTAAVTPAFPTTCVSTANYLALLAGATTGPLTAAGNSAGGSAITGSNSSIITLDGAIIASANLWAGVFPPCFTTATSAGVQITLGTNPTALVPTYAGFVDDSVAGLYQIDVTVPATGYTYAPTLPTGGGPIALTVLVNSVPSQTGVTVYTN